MITLNDYYEKGNLVLLFPPKNPSAGDLSSIESIVNQQSRINHEYANLLVFSPRPLDNLIAHHLSGIPVLLDPVSHTRESYSGLVAPGLIDQEDLLIFILDAYGATCVCLVGQKPGESIVEEILSWLLYLSIQCPE